MTYTDHTTATQVNAYPFSRVRICVRKKQPPAPSECGHSLIQIFRDIQESDGTTAYAGRVHRSESEPLATVLQAGASLI